MRNARIGRDLRQQGIKAGTFTMAVEGKDTVGYYHTETGPEEVYRLTGVALTPMQQWASTIAFDVITLLASVFMIMTSALRVGNAIQIFQPELNALATAIQQSFRLTDSAFVQAKEVTVAVIRVTIGLNLGYSIWSKVVMGSWWSLAFTVTNVVLMMIAAIASNFVVLVIRLVQMAVSLAQLGVDLQSMPNTEAAAAD